MIVSRLLQKLSPSHLGARLRDFVSEPASPRPLAIFRIGVSLVLFLQALALAPHLLELFGAQGVVQWSVIDPLTAPGLPRVNNLATWLAPVGIDNATCVRAVFGIYLAALLGLLVGWRSRWSALAAWLTHMALCEGATLSLYGVDMFAHIALFYAVCFPVGADLSYDRLAGRSNNLPTPEARLSLRVLQLHLCIAYLATGLDKAMGPQWWNGEAIWRATMRADMAQWDVSFLASVPWLAMVLGWSTLAIEIGYAVLMWPVRTRLAWGLATVGLHLGIAVMMGLWSFSAMMAVLTIAAFLHPSPRTSPSREGGSSGKGAT